MKTPKRTPQKKNRKAVATNAAPVYVNLPVFLPHLMLESIYAAGLMDMLILEGFKLYVSSFCLLCLVESPANAQT